jgi:acyl-CoA synthetase (AMP-forming)/AMP-acid ligase II
VIVPRWELEKCCWAIQRYRANIFFLVPPVAVQLIKGGLGRLNLHICMRLNNGTYFNGTSSPADSTVDKYDLSSIKYIVTGAAPMSAAVQEEVSRKLGAHVSQSYGLTAESDLVLDARSWG